ncbi:MAG: cytochrome P450, partial [bacterium]
MPPLDAIDLTDLDRFANGFPHQLFTHLRRERPVWFHAPTAHTPGGEGFWVLTRHADIVAAASDAAGLSSHTGGQRDGGGTLIEDLPTGFAAGVLLNMMDDPRHRHIRRIAAPALSPRTLRELEDELRARTAVILDAALARGRCDFLIEIAAELPLQAIAKLLGIPQADRHQLFGWANATLDYDDRDLGAQSEKAAAAGAAMFEYGGRLLAEKRRALADDMLSAVAHGQVPGADGALEPVSELEQQMFFNLLVFAGSETTRNSIALGVLALIEHPQQWAQLVDDRGALPGAVEEMLRWASSTPYNRRTAT